LRRCITLAPASAAAAAAAEVGMQEGALSPPTTTHPYLLRGDINYVTTDMIISLLILQAYRERKRLLSEIEC